MARLSDNIRNARRDAGMNQLELAKASGVGAATVARLEAGTQDDPRISTLRKLADALGVDPRDLHAIGCIRPWGLIWMISLRTRRRPRRLRRPRMYETTGELLVERRLRAGLTQERLAHLSGVDRKTISRLETGAREKPHSETVRRLARGLKVFYAALLGCEFDETQYDVTIEPVDRM